MAHIKEPKGVDFVIASEPLTKEARQEINDFIRQYKKSKVAKKAKATIIVNQLKATHA